MTTTGRWATCGAMDLTGDPDGPPLAPPTIAASEVDEALAPFRLDASVLGERAALMGLTRGGTTSCGGASRLLEAADGWVAITLARPDDVAALPAVFEVAAGRFDGSAEVSWSAVAELVAARPADEVAARCRLLDVPAVRVGEGTGTFDVRGEGRSRTTPAPAPTVVDLTALWAGPLATRCLLRAGAEVIKVEDLHRPDGARAGDAAFFDLLNAGKRSVALDLTDPHGRARLRALVDRADVVVTSARAAALDRLGLHPDAFLAGGTDRTWVAITAHGWTDRRVGFGDDVAAGAGLVAWHPDGTPRFAADAVGDPIGGAAAAAAAWRCWQQGGRWFVDGSLGGAVAATLTAERSTARAAAGPPWTLDGIEVAPPAAPIPGPTAAPLGADTDAVLAQIR